MTISASQSGSVGDLPDETAPPSASRIEISAARGWRRSAKLGALDVGEALKLWPLVWTLSLFDIRLRYRGSMLGPFWLTLSTAIMVGAMGFLYAALFHQNISHYLPYLTISLVLWTFISTITSEGSTCFTQAEGMIRAMRMPHALHAARVVVRNLLVLAHNVVVIVLVFGIFRVVPNADAFSLLPAILLWGVDAFAICLLLGVFGARFRDIPPIVGSVMQIAFYLTPIMWNPNMLAQRGLAPMFVQLNPFYDLLEILRGPVLGEALNVGAWYAALGYSAVLVALAGAVFVAARPRIPYWV